MMGKPNIGSGGTRLRALDEQTLVPPKRVFFQYSKIPAFHYSSPVTPSFIPAPLAAGFPITASAALRAQYYS